MDRNPLLPVKLCVKFVNNVDGGAVVAQRKYFLGIPVVAEEDIEQGPLSGELNTYMVSRVADLPADAGSPALLARRTRTICEGCREVCWLDPAGFDELRGMAVEIICTRCAIARLQCKKAELQGQADG